MYKFFKGEASEKELFDSVIEPYCGMKFELFEKMSPILTSDEIWQDGRTVYETKIPLENGEVVDVTVNRKAGFVVLNRGGKKSVRLKLNYSIETDES